MSGGETEPISSREHTAVLTQDRLERWGMRVGADPGAPLFVALRGELGAGKSVLARAIGRGAGVTEPMPSPTFGLMMRYELPDTTVLHLDLYRLRTVQEILELGWNELGARDEIVLVEWAERAGALLPADRWEVELVDTENPRERRVTVRALGDAPDPPPLED